MTQVLNADNPNAVETAAQILRGGGLVAFPTETVYGLGANALDSEAVGKIFAAKGRPATNPLIVHVPDIEAAKALAAEWTDTAERLARAFWAGSLTLVVPKTNAIPDIVSAGGNTVGLRVPAHPAALALLQKVGLPLAAPSANRSTQLSPTTAEHVLRGLNERIDLILDGGATTGGIESTVVDVSVSPPVLLRPGLITREQLEVVVGDIALPQPEAGNAKPARSPGMMARHYAPNATLEILPEREARARASELAEQGEHVGLLTFTRQLVTDARIAAVAMPSDANPYAARLYAALHEFDSGGMTRIVVAAPPNEPDWLAVRDRLKRAATPAEKDTP